MKKIILILMMAILIVPGVLGVCTLTLDKSEYNPGETATVEASCDSGTEINRPYSIIWTNGTAVVETDSGTTPSTISQPFFETYQIPVGAAGYNWTNANVTMNGTNLEGVDYFNTTNTPGNALIITDCRFKPQAFLGSDFTVDCGVEDVDGYAIDNAKCIVYATDTNDAPLQMANQIQDSTAGRFVATGPLNPSNLNEDTSYLAKIRCHCEIGDNSCWDSLGNTETKLQGATSIAFTTAKWLTVNTLVDKTEYKARQVARICVNITNEANTSRIPLDIYYQVRCGQNDDDTDRVVIAANPEERPDDRGISVGSTQNQCWALMIPEKKWLMGRTSECYASTEVWVLNEENHKIKGYFSTSSVFNVTISDLGINPDWQVSGTNNEILTASVNLSDIKYQDYQGTFIGNVDIRLDMHYPETTDAFSDSNKDGQILFEHMQDIKYISSYAVTYCNGTAIDSELEVTNDGYIELEVRNVNQSSACINATIVTQTYEERQTVAYESLVNKIGQWLERLFIRK